MKTPFDVLKKTIGFLLLAVMLCLSTCGAPADQVEDSTPPEQTKEDTPPSSEPADAGAEDTPGKVTYSTQGVSFEVSEDWLQAEGMDMFYTDKNEVYGLNGVSPLGSEKLRRFFDKIRSLQKTNRINGFCISTLIFPRRVPKFTLELSDSRI